MYVGFKELGISRKRVTQVTLKGGREVVVILGPVGMSLAGVSTMMWGPAGALEMLRTNPPRENKNSGSRKAGRPRVPLEAELLPKDIKKKYKNWGVGRKTKRITNPETSLLTSDRLYPHLSSFLPWLTIKVRPVAFHIVRAVFCTLF